MSEKQTIITIGREFGSGGHDIAEELSKRLNINFYDKGLLEDVSKKYDIEIERIEKLEERPTSLFSGMYISEENKIAFNQFKVIKDKAKQGESFIVVGRCAEHVLKDNPNAISIFVTGNLPEKRKEVMRRYNIGREEAEDLIYKTDKRRKKYHNYYCDGKWGDSRNYDLCINSSSLGISGTVNVILEYLKNRGK